MKKTLVLAVIAVAVISVSCRKDRTCTCTANITDTDASSAGTITVAGTESTTDTWKSVKKSQAKLTDCYNKTVTTVDTYTAGSVVHTDTQVKEYTCTLK